MRHDVGMRQDCFIAIIVTRSQITSQLESSLAQTRYVTVCAMHVAVLHAARSAPAASAAAV